MNTSIITNVINAAVSSFVTFFRLNYTTDYHGTLYTRLQKRTQGSFRPNRGQNLILDTNIIVSETDCKGPIVCVT